MGFKWQQPVPDLFDGSEDFFSERFFWILVWRASKEHFNAFGTKSILKGSPMTSKETNGSFGQGVWNWIKGNVPRFEKIRSDANIETSCELPAGAGKFPPVTRRNRRQSVPAEIFACIRRYFYLRISLPAAFAGNFARASFTVYAKSKKVWKLLQSSTPLTLSPTLKQVPVQRKEDCLAS